MGIEYYQAVLRDGVRTYAEFAAWRERHPVAGVIEWGFTCLPKDKLNSFFVMNRKKNCLSTPQASIIAVIYRLTGVEYSIRLIWQLRYKEESVAQ